MEEQLQGAADLRALLAGDSLAGLALAERLRDSFQVEPFGMDEDSYLPSWRS